MATGFAEPIQQYKAEWREDQHPRGTAGEFAEKPGDKSESESAVDSDGPSDEDLAGIWNHALSSHADLSDEELRHVLDFAAHLHGHHKDAHARGEITPEQLSSLHGMIDGHVARLQQELRSREGKRVFNAGLKEDQQPFTDKSDLDNWLMHDDEAASHHKQLLQSDPRYRAMSEQADREAEQAFGELDAEGDETPPYTEQAKQVDRYLARHMIASGKHVNPGILRELGIKASEQQPTQPQDAPAGPGTSAGGSEPVGQPAAPGHQDEPGNTPPVGTSEPGAQRPDASRDPGVYEQTGRHIANVPGPVKSLLESLHKLRDTRKTGKVETTELGPEYAREMYDHIKSLRLTGDNFGEVHDLSTELGHGALGYSSPAGNVVMMPPKFKGEDWKVRYVLPHESQTQAAQQQAVAPASTSPQPSAPQTGEVVGKQGGSLGESAGFPWESGEQEAGIGPDIKQPEKPATPPVKQPKRAKGVSPNTKLGQAIIQAVGDDPADQEGFKQVVGEIYAEEDRQTRQRNNSLRELLSNFGYEGRDIGQFIRAAQRYEDADQFMRRSPIGKKFDQLVAYAQQYHPNLIGTANTGGGSYSDPEAALFEQLKTGLQRPPQPYDELIISKALEQLSAGERSSQEHAARMASDPTYRSEWEEIQSRPFSRRGWKLRYVKWARQNLGRWYKYGKQLSIACDEDEHQVSDFGL